MRQRFTDWSVSDFYQVSTTVSRRRLVYDPATYEVRQAVQTDRAGVLYALTREATVVEGDALANVALRLAEE